VTATTRIFTTNKTQAVRLPKAVAFPEDVSEVEIVVVGESRVITPVAKRWDFFFDQGVEVSEDFMTDRDQPAPQERSTW
jgi:antitoxin VapB